ncbi:hypothetical protein GCK32_002942 [Trichostrongylus colubriformis]|uniref:SPK domain-containing protein n=1 Tax=Trichostrongylus colubriformis TaxID=6319 RepID=A0AAN8IH28_TRICO
MMSYFVILLVQMKGRKRAAYTKKDETEMWCFVYDKLKIAATAEPKGLLMWEDYVSERNCSRSPHSLNTHFRRHMINSLHNADLDCQEMMFLYRRLRLKMDSVVKAALELKFSVSIELNENAYVKTFKKVVRAVNQREKADGDSAQNTVSLTGRLRGALHISDERSSDSPPRKRSSLNYTQEIENLHVNSRYQVRYGRPPFQVVDEDFNSSNDELPLTQPSSSTANVSDQPRAPESTDQNQQSYAKETSSRASRDQFSLLEEQVSESSDHVRVTTARECTPNATRVAVAINDAADRNPGNPPVDQIYVSETSESCEVAYQRLYKAITNPSSQLVDSDDSEQFQRTTSEWQARMEQMLNQYGISGAHAESYLNALHEAQKNLLGRNHAEYSKLLCALEKCMEKKLQVLKHRLKPIADRPLCVASTSNVPTRSINLMHTDSSKVPLTVRERKTFELLSPLVPHYRLVTNEQVVDRMIRFEGLAARMPEKYGHYMLKAREAAKERVHRAKGRSPASIPHEMT